jgi:hypothetical protein
VKLAVAVAMAMVVAVVVGRSKNQIIGPFVSKVGGEIA